MHILMSVLVFYIYVITRGIKKGNKESPLVIMKVGNLVEYHNLFLCLQSSCQIKFYLNHTLCVILSDF